jgi:hypothetical protein
MARKRSTSSAASGKSVKPRLYNSIDEFMQAMLPKLHAERQHERGVEPSLARRIRREHGDADGDGNAEDIARSDSAPKSPPS